MHTETRVNAGQARVTRHTEKREQERTRGEGEREREKEREKKKIICHRIDKIIDTTGDFASALNAGFVDASRALVP